MSRASAEAPCLRSRYPRVSTPGTGHRRLRSRRLRPRAAAESFRHSTNAMVSCSGTESRSEKRSDASVSTASGKIVAGALGSRAFRPLSSPIVTPPFRGRYPTHGARAVRLESARLAIHRQLPNGTDYPTRADRLGSDLPNRGLAGNGLLPSHRSRQQPGSARRRCSPRQPYCSTPLLRILTRSSNRGRHLHPNPAFRTSLPRAVSVIRQELTRRLVNLPKTGRSLANSPWSEPVLRLSKIPERPVGSSAANQQQARPGWR